MKADQGVEREQAAALDGRSARWADHRAARRAELVHAARRAVHHNGPDLSMDEIAAAAGTSKPIFYRYFADKTGLQMAVGERVVDEMHAALEDAVSAASTPRDGLRAMVGVYLEMVASSPNVYWFVTRPTTESASAPVGHFMEAVTEIVAAPFARVLTASDTPEGIAQAWASGAVGFVRGVGEWWLGRSSEGEVHDRDEVAARVAAWLWAGPVGLLAQSSRPTTTAATAPPTPEEQS